MVIYNITKNIMAPDSLKRIINEILDNNWNNIINGEDVYECLYDSSSNMCKIKISFQKEQSKIVSDTYIIRIKTKWFAE